MRGEPRTIGSATDKLRSKHPADMGEAQKNRRAVLILEDEAELRGFAARLLEDGELDTIECESAEAALATMLIRGRASAPTSLVNLC